MVMVMWIKNRKLNNGYPAWVVETLPSELQMFGLQQATLAVVPVSHSSYGFLYIFIAQLHAA